VGSKLQKGELSRDLQRRDPSRTTPSLVGHEASLGRPRKNPRKNGRTGGGGKTYPANEKSRVPPRGPSTTWVNAQPRKTGRNRNRATPPGGGEEAWGGCRETPVGSDKSPGRSSGKGDAVSSQKKIGRRIHKKEGCSENLQKKASEKEATNSRRRKKKKKQITTTTSWSGERDKGVKGENTNHMQGILIEAGIAGRW